MAHPLGGSKPLLGARFGLLRLDFTVLRWRGDHQIFEQMTGNVRDLVHRAVERLGVRLRRMRPAADLAHVLQRGRVHLVEDLDSTIVIGLAV